MLYKILMSIFLPLLALGWLAYWWWERKLDKEEAALPEEDKSTDTLKKSRSDVADWAEQMSNFKKPERKPPNHSD
jgi:hypothetical protein